MNSTMTVREAAGLLRIDPQTLRVGIQRGAFPFGAAFKRPGSEQFTYVIYRPKFEELTGIKTEKEGEPE